MARTRRGRGGRGQHAREAQEMTWYRMDLHVHTPASADYRDPAATYLGILLAAEEHDLDIIALTDHNSVSGIAAMRREIEDLELLEELNRLLPAEQNILSEYRRLLAQILVLPGFEFTAAYGFHILAIFPPETTIRRLEHILLTLDVPEDRMESGSGADGETADVLTAYETLAASGALIIPAHINTAHGTLMHAARFGVKTKTAYTQSPLISALEVTDLDDPTRRGTAHLFSGAMPEFPRRMHCIQGSNAHRIRAVDGGENDELGVGDRATEALLPERSFAALKALFASDDFARTRPYVPPGAVESDPLHAARAAGPNQTLAFHEQVRSRRSRYRPILKDVVGFANTNGGTVYVGASAAPSQTVVGVAGPEEAARGLRDAIARSVVPRLDVTVDIAASGGKPILVVNVPKGVQTPYATDAGQVFVRQGGETVIALRDEIVQLVREAAAVESGAAPATPYERSWTAPRRVPDEEDEQEPPESEALITATAHIVAPPPAEQEPEATQAEPEAAPPEQPPARRPRRRRRRTAAPIESAEGAPPPAEEAEAAAPPEVFGAPPEIAVEAAAPPPATETMPASEYVAADAAELAVPAAPPVIAEPEPEPETERPRPRPRRRSRRAAPQAELAVAAEAPADAPEPVPPAPARPARAATPAPVAEPSAAEEHAQPTAPEPPPPAAEPAAVPVPTTGIEVVGVTEQDGAPVYTLRDLKSGRVVEMTRRAARRLWRQAILAREAAPPDPDAIIWDGNLGYLGSTERDGERRYHLAARANGTVRAFYAVSPDGLDPAWQALITRAGDAT